MSEQQLIEICFQCKQCSRLLRTKVRARREDEDLLKWMQVTVNRAVAEAHQIASFGCDSPKFDLAIPMLPADDPHPWIGKWNSEPLGDANPFNIIAKDQ